MNVYPVSLACSTHRCQKRAPNDWNFRQLEASPVDVGMDPQSSKRTKFLKAQPQCILLLKGGAMFDFQHPHWASHNCP